MRWLPASHFDFGDRMTVCEFKAHVKSGGFIDYDGYGHAVVSEQVDVDAPIYPSAVERIPPEATHILWFNR